MNRFSEFAAQRPKLHFWSAGLACLFLLIMVLVPTFSPTAARILHPLTIDTDPENMLPADAPVRVFHNEMKERFGLYDVVVVGVVNTERTVFNAETLTDVADLTEFAKSLTWEVDGKRHGVVGAEMVAPTEVDIVEQAGEGAVRFEWLMEGAPASDAEAAEVLRRAQTIPMFRGSLVSDSGDALALYLPIVEKDDSYRVARALRDRIDGYASADTYHITGLPIAQDQFGVEMFVQMAIAAPAAMVLIFALMWAFFRHLNLVVAPMVVAMVSVLSTMGLLVVTGNTVHIMSSMIPVFIMPIAVLDSVHVLSEFYDRYPATRDRRKTLNEVMVTLWKPMLFTSLTTAVGFGSLAFANIPPVQVFGIFVAFGVMAAWFLTITLIPAYIMAMPEKSLDGFGLKPETEEAGKASWVTSLLQTMGGFAFKRAGVVMVIAALLYGLAGYGVSQITINDNPVKWFEPDHDIRVADRVLNEEFAGTYMAYLALDAGAAESASSLAVTEADLEGLPEDVRGALAPRLAEGSDALRAFAETSMDTAESDETYYGWDEFLLRLDRKEQASEVFKSPELLHWMEGLQAHLQTETWQVGKSSGLPEIVKTVHRELKSGDEAEYRIPDSPEAVAQTLITFQSSHRPNDLWDFVTPDYRSASLWLQLKSGDNKDMVAVVDAAEAYISANPPPVELSAEWFGLTYINVVWQQEMVTGMLKAFFGSFAIVLVMMAFLFRSVIWGVFAMVPLTLSIGVVYGLIGLVGKDYDMPIAVLSSLSLGLSIDYAIHFMARSREIRTRHGTWQAALDEVFGEPGRAIMRNVIVVGVGFLPLLLAPLTPYQTVGAFISLILVISGFASLLILPALITLCQRWMFPQSAVPEAAE
ncbi:MAG: MMPL family transporter [Rhodobacteraceae bacterium]|nr:MMPL family transporter [Paracoccaceae bacterium]